MSLIAKIAWRNIMRHRGKSLIIGSILFIGALLMTVGNGVISGMDRGLKKNIVEGFCGDAVLVSDKQESDNVFLDMMGKAVEPVAHYKAIDSVLKTVAYVNKWLPMGKNFAIALNEDGGMADGVFVLGVKLKEYRAFFGENLKVIEGAIPKDNSRPFVLIPTGWRKIYAEYYSFLLSPEGSRIDTSTLSKEIKENLSEMGSKHDVVYMGMNADNSTTDVRMPIRAIVKYRSFNSIWGQFPILDIESYRQCLGYFTSQETSAPVRKESLDLLATSDESLDDMFGEGDLVTVQKRGGQTPQMLEAGSLAVAKDTALRGVVDLDAGVFNMVLVRFNQGVNLDKAVKQLNDELKRRGLGVRAISWKKATGMIGSMAVLIKSALFVFVMFLFFVAIIIIVNTLSMAAIERTSEIGMMRAIGARRGFIRLMFLGETSVLSAVFGGAGIVVGIIAVNIIATFNITTDNDMVQLLYGGDTFRPLLSLVDVLLAVVQLVIVTVLAVLYPIRVASSITPLDAVSRE
ncbi:MAG: FtsX-like permease family protein [Chitinispirillaceae bacterium]|nr:FtsX-like permease family protein [Chitinispirillaceae bacterium]